MKPGRFAFWRKKPPSPKLSNLFPALIRGRKDVQVNELATIISTITGFLSSALIPSGGTAMTATVAATGTTYAVTGTAVLTVGQALSYSLVAASTIISLSTSKSKKQTSFSGGGISINGRLPTDPIRILYGVARTGTTWGYWTTTSEDALQRNEYLHIVVSCCEGICEIVKDYEQPFWTGWGQSGLVSGGIYTGATYNFYKIQMESGGASFKWSDDGGTTWEATGVAITGGWQDLNNGMKIKFKNTSGYKTVSYWTFYAGDGVWIDDRLIYYYQDIFGRSFADYYFHSGTPDQAVDANLQASVPEYTNAHRYTCYAYMKLKASFSNEFTVWKGTEVRFTLRKIDIYDTRTSTTGFSDNPALIYRDYYTNTRYGGGKASTYLDTTSINDAADWCETNGFTFNGVFLDRQEHRDNLEEIMLNGRMFRIDSGGVEKLKVWDNDAAALTFTQFEEQVDIQPESFSISQQGIPETYNRVICSYYDRAKGYIYCEQKYEDLTQMALDGDAKELRLELIGTNNGTQAKRIAKFHQLRSKYSEKYNLLLHPKCYALEPGDMITATHEFPAWTAVKTRVESIGIIQSGMVPMVTIKENAAIYDLTVDIDTTDEPWSTYVNPPLNPISQVTGVDLHNAGIYVDSQTGTTMAKVMVEWTDNASDENIVDYEILFQEKQTDAALPASIPVDYQGSGHEDAGHVPFGHGGAMQVNWNKH